MVVSIKPSLVKRFHNHMVLEAALAIARYSVFVEEHAITLSFFELQEIRVEPRKQI
jgi:hypothetical protein